MPMRKYNPDQIVTLLRHVEAEWANGKTTPQACKEAEITGQTYYIWRKEYGGLKPDQTRFGMKSECQISLFRIQGRTYCDERVGEPNLTTC